MLISSDYFSNTSRTECLDPCQSVTGTISVDITLHSHTLTRLCITSSGNPDRQPIPCRQTEASRHVQLAPQILLPLAPLLDLIQLLQAPRAKVSGAQ
jgi:hypothetical protein